jgi:hypothetical protein
MGVAPRAGKLPAGKVFNFGLSLILGQCDADDFIQDAGSKVDMSKQVYECLKIAPWLNAN